MKNKFIEYFVKITNNISELSTCYSRKVGTLIVTDDYKILATGYNGTPSGMIECKELSIILDWIYNQYIVKLTENNSMFSYFLETLESYVEMIKTNTITQMDINNANVWKIINKYSKNREQIIFVFEKLLALFKLYRQSELLKYSKYTVDKFIKDFNFIHYKYEIHAEQNAISQCAKYGINTNNTNLFVTTLPCLDCARLIIASGIKRIYYINDYVDKNYREKSILFLKMNNVEIIHIKKTK